MLNELFYFAVLLMSVCITILISFVLFCNAVNLLLKYNNVTRKVNCEFETSYSNIQSIPLKFRLSINNEEIKIVAENCPGDIDFKFNYRDGSYSVTTIYKTCAVNSSINFPIETLKNDDEKIKYIIIGVAIGVALILVPILFIVCIAMLAFCYAKHRKVSQSSEYY